MRSSDRHLRLGAMLFGLLLALPCAGRAQTSHAATTHASTTHASTTHAATEPGATGRAPAVRTATARGHGPVCPASTRQTLDLPNLRHALAAGQPIVIVAFGSSSTEGVGASAPARSYPAQLEAMLRSAWPTRSVTVLNRGRGGQTADEMMTRLRSDVLAVKPTVVVWQVGANATLRAMDPTRFGDFVDAGVKAMTAIGADVVLMDNQLAPRILASPSHRIYGEVLAKEAAVRHIALFSRTALMREWILNDRNGPHMVGNDGLHHTDHGYACLADALAGSLITAASAPISLAAEAAAGPRRLGPRSAAAQSLPGGR